MRTDIVVKLLEITAEITIDVGVNSGILLYENNNILPNDYVFNELNIFIKKDLVVVIIYGKNESAMAMYSLKQPQ